MFATYRRAKIDEANGKLERRRTELEAWTRNLRMSIARNIEKELADPQGFFSRTLRLPVREGGPQYKKLFMKKSEFAEWRVKEAAKKRKRLAGKNDHQQGQADTRVNFSRSQVDGTKRRESIRKRERLSRRPGNYRKVGS